MHPVIGVLIDQAFDLIERDNPKLKGVLTRNYARPELDQIKLGEIITLFSNLDLVGDEREDMLGRSRVAQIKGMGAVTPVPVAFRRCGRRSGVQAPAYG